MQHSDFTTRVVGNLAAFIALLLVTGWGIDRVAGWLGYQPTALCAVLPPVVAVAYGVGVLITCIGVIMSVVSLGKSASGLALAIGGVLLFALPLMLPRYLGAACLS